MSQEDIPNNILIDEETDTQNSSSSDSNISNSNNTEQPQVNKVRLLFDNYKNKLTEIYENKKSSDLIELLIKDFTVGIKEFIPVNNIFTQMSNQMLNKLVTIFLTENDELINKIILQDTQDIIPIEFTDIDSLPSSQELEFTKQLAKEIELEQEEQVKQEEVEQEAQEFNDIDKLYALLFKFEELISEDSIDIKAIMPYMIKFGIIKNRIVSIILSNSQEIEKDLENTGLNSISVSNMFNAVKDKISESEYIILFKNVKYYTIKFS